MSVLVLIDLTSQASYEFQYFPDNVRTQRRVNWRPQDTTIGTKPLMYESRDPKILSFQELWLDNSFTNESLNDVLEELESFTTDEIDGRGAPPPMLVTWGDRKLRCVLQDLTVEEQFFTPEGNCIRARLSIELIEIQDEGQAVGVNVI